MNPNRLYGDVRPETSVSKCPSQEAVDTAVEDYIYIYIYIYWYLQVVFTFLAARAPTQAEVWWWRCRVVAVVLLQCCCSSVVAALQCSGRESG